MTSSSSSMLSIIMRNANKNSSILLFIYMNILMLTIFSSESSAGVGSKNGQGMGDCSRRYKSIISFGDSLADTGNLLHIISTAPTSASEPSLPPPFALPPYGETYFHHPTGRCSDGRLIIDFVAEHIGLPLVPPYFKSTKNSSRSGNFEEGVNFAVAGSTALSYEFFEERGIHNPSTNASLGIELGWFKQMLPSLCHTPSNCKKYLQSSLILMGEIGGNDYNHAFEQGLSIEEIRPFVPLVVNAIASAVDELIELGAVTLMVPGNLPIGCSAMYLSGFMSRSIEEDYNPKTGCIIWLNKFAEYHNKMLRIELDRVQQRHPHATIIYADYYNAAMSFYRDPLYYGFSGGALTACCGGGGPYNYNASVTCGYPASRTCDDPSSYVAWDGAHLTEAAYRWIAKGLLEGPYTVPPFNSSCDSQPMSGGTEWISEVA